MTVLFADLVGFTSRSERMDVEDVRGTLAPYHALLRDELEHYGGTVEKFIGDAVMALFGAPVAHEDDPERAVRAALSIRAAIVRLNDEQPGLDLHVRVGVNTGEALVVLGADAGARRGDGVRRRRQYRRPGCSPRHRSTASWWARPPSVPPTARSPTAQPIRSWPRESRAGAGVGGGRGAGRGSASTSCSGRPRRWSAAARSSTCCATRCAAAGRSGLPQLVTLVGVPGIGKSRLVWELFEAGRGRPRLHHLAPGPLAPVRRRCDLLGARRDGQGAGRILDSDTTSEAEAKLRASSGS